MKYLVVVFDGMADRRIPELGNHTPMEVAKKPTVDALARQALCGTVSNVPEGMVPESDTANLAILSYDPKVYSKGRSPLEAVSMGLEMAPDQTAFRCNVVTLSGDGDYDSLTMVDHSADEISTDEARCLIETLEEKLGNADRHFYTGVSYRHCLLWRGVPDTYPFMRPHDILGRPIREYLPQGDEGERYYRLMRDSYEILREHPVNVARRAAGKRPANSAWLWSPGKKPALPSFREKWGLRGTVISAVDLIKGIGLCAGMESIDVEGATGNIHTNYTGKADAAIDAFRRGQDLVFVHVEAPDECGHRAEIENKVRSIELIDEKIVAPIVNALSESGEDYRVMILPDHPTPIEIRTHSMEPVPFLIYSSNEEQEGVENFNEFSAERMNFYLPSGTELMRILTQN